MDNNETPWYKSDAFNYALIGLAVVGIAVQVSYLVDLLDEATDEES